MLRKSTLKEGSMEFSEDRNTGSEPDQRLQLAMKGDGEELGRLFTSNMPQLYRVALRILGTPQDAEDALQDGFLGAMRHLGEFECRSRFSTWLTRIVINAALMRLRKNRRDVPTSFDENLDQDKMDLAVTVTDPRPNPEEICVWKERFQMFERELQSLPAAYQSILWLRDVQGMSTQEAAETLGVKSTTVKSQLHRARSRLGMETFTARSWHRFLQTARSEPGAIGRQFSAEVKAEVGDPGARVK
jgi:RNA polymerase sigma-70 factor, ECF subfamily